ncbi:MAG: enoyl-CoA hydratase-related protein [Solirubrobacterales bacterium]
MNADIASSTDLVLAERRGAVLVLTLNRPDRLNAWTDELEVEYFAQLDAAEADPEVRAVVLTGAGRGFCAGADFDLLEEATADGEARSIVKRPRPRRRPLDLRKPLIAAINGPAAGLGLVEALYCDVRFCVPGAKLTTAFARRGLVAEYGVAWILPRLVGTSRALDLLMSARVLLGSEAAEIGLVDHLAEPGELVEQAVAYATDLAANCSPTSMAIVKRQVLDGVGQSFEESYAEAERLIAESFLRADAGEGVASYLEKRPPAFPPLAD